MYLAAPVSFAGPSRRSGNPAARPGTRWPGIDDEGALDDVRAGRQGAGGHPSRETPARVLGCASAAYHRSGAGSALRRRRVHVDVVREELAEAEPPVDAVAEVARLEDADPVARSPAAARRAASVIARPMPRPRCAGSVGIAYRPATPPPIETREVATGCPSTRPSQRSGTGSAGKRRGISRANASSVRRWIGVASPPVHSSQSASTIVEELLERAPRR